MEALTSNEEGLPEKLDEKDRVMLQHAERLTSEPETLEEQDLEPLREQGFSDRDILDVTLITAYFNFVNRVDHGLGVENEDWFPSEGQ